MATGENSPEKQAQLIVSYNKYFNQERHPATFVTSHRLDTINYRKNMTIQVYSGLGAPAQNLRIDNIEENKNSIRVHIGYEIMDNSDAGRNPFVIVQTPKSKKTVVFFENGVERKNEMQNIYIKN